MVGCCVLAVVVCCRCLLLVVVGWRSLLFGLSLAFFDGSCLSVAFVIVLVLRARVLVSVV